MRAARAAAAAAAITAMLVTSAAAQASSIVFTKDDGNVWLAGADGSGQYQVTRNGTASDPYESPSQADDGTIVVVRGSGSGRRLYRMRQNGSLLNEPIGTVGVADDPRIAPNGSLVAYWFLTPVSYSGCFYCIGTYDQTVYTYPDRLTRYEEIPGPHCCEEPSWMANEGVFLTNGSCTAWYHRLGAPEAQQWFNDYALGGDCRSYRDGELSPALDRIALVRGDSQETIQLYAANGPPPANPTPGCTFSGAPGGKFIGPTWSPDGRSLAWEDATGIVIAALPSVTDCDAINAAGGARTVIPGGHKPDWGPADVDPGARTSGGIRPDTRPPTVRLTVRRQRLGAALRRGFVVGLRSSEPGAGGAELLLRKTTIAAAARALPRAGATRLVLRFTAKARRELASRRSVVLTLRVLVLDRAANPRLLTRRVMLRR